MSGQYLYGFVHAEATLPADLKGLSDAPARLIASGTIAAVVSPIAGGRLRPERRNMAAHQRVLQALAAAMPVLPVSFGVVIDDQDEVVTLLEAQGEVLAEQLEEIGDRVEMSLRVSWEVPNIFAHFVERWPELRSARDAALDSGAHSDKVNAGRLFEQLIAAERDSHIASIRAILDAVSHDVISEPPRSETEIARLAFLVDRQRVGEFEQAVGVAATGFDERYRFDFGGPWAPYSFVKLQLQTSGGD
jgi:hypothetical protein